MFYFDDFCGKKVLKSDKLNKVNHFFTTRELLLKTKDENKTNLMLLNRNLLKHKFDLKAVVTPQQRHTANIEIADLNIEKYPETDALILKDKNFGIFLNFADCTPVIFYDRINNIAAIAHAGWRGTVQKIAQKTVFKMMKLFNSKPENIIALIGPSICFECFETSFEIAKQLSETLKNGENFIKEKNNKFYADLKKINETQLFEIGLKEIDVCEFCTYHNNEMFFSYRKENKTTDRISAFISLS